MTEQELDAWGADGMDGLNALWSAMDELEPVLDAATARAEAAEQRAEALAAELAQARAEGEAAGRAAERADVVAMLRNAADEVGGVWMADAADGIEAGEHVGAAGAAR